MTANCPIGEIACDVRGPALKGGRSSRFSGIAVCFTLFAVLTVASTPALAAEIVYPTADGTLVDGGVFGSRDGIIDNWAWEFGPGGVSGAVSLATQNAASAVEHRVFFEYDLRQLDLRAPVHATLTFRIRGASVFPFPDVTVHVYSYPADLIESVADFSAGPALLQGAVMTTARQPPRSEVLDVTGLVNAALTGARKVAFRFQIDPASRNEASQVFIDALDTEPATKPFLTIRSAVPGDADNDGDVDRDDFAIFADCAAGPGTPPRPTTPDVNSDDCLSAFNRDGDADVDLEDYSSLLSSFMPQ